MKEESGSGSGSGLTIVGSTWGRVCDTCRARPCTVYCRADSAYLCSGCDARVHAANKVASRHERVWVCEGCERAPAAFLCKADAARLCVSCDSDIHSANPLARRHQRVAILPMSGCQMEEDEVEVEDEAASWLLPIPEKNGSNQVGLFGGEVDEYLDLVEYNSCEDQYNNNNNNNNNGEKSYGGGDSVVPVQCEGKDQVLQLHHNHQCFQLEGLEFESPKPAYSYNSTIDHTVSVSSLDIGVVPDSTRSDVSMSHPRPPKGTIDLFSGPSTNMPSQLSPMDREARVLRYREKKKTRKFEKTIRYASRKAYAETRPRIKGRFAKRTDVEIEVDQMFSTSLMAETGYGIVPSF